MVRCYRTLSNKIQNHWLICIAPFPRKQPPLQIGPQRSRARPPGPRIDSDGLASPLGGNVPQGDVIWVFRKLKNFGCGSFKVGRKGHQSRFEWDVKMVGVGQAAAGETEQVEEVSPEEAGEENRSNSLFKHTFRLRPDQSVTVELPADLTSQEAARMARFIETLPFQGDTIDRAS